MRRTLAPPPPMAVLFAASGMAGLTGATAWLESLMRGAAALGAICGQGHPVGLPAGVHCPSCYAALALALASGMLLAMAARLARAPAARRA